MCHRINIRNDNNHERREQNISISIYVIPIIYIFFNSPSSPYHPIKLQFPSRRRFLTFSRPRRKNRRKNPRKKNNLQRLNKIYLRPGTAVTVWPSCSSQSTCGVGEPWAEQLTWVPVVFENVRWAGGSSRNTGPWLWAVVDTETNLNDSLNI